MGNYKEKKKEREKVLGQTPFAIVITLVVLAADYLLFEYIIPDSLIARIIFGVIGFGGIIMLILFAFAGIGALLSLGSPSPNKQEEITNSQEKTAQHPGSFSEEALEPRGEEGESSDPRTAAEKFWDDLLPNIVGFILFAVLVAVVLTVFYLVCHWFHWLGA